MVGLKHMQTRPVYLLYAQKAGCSSPSRRRTSRRRWAVRTRWTCCASFWRSASSCWFSAMTINNKNNARTAPRDWSPYACGRVTYIQHILLDDGVHDDGHQHVEEDSGQVLDAVVEVVHGRLIWAFMLREKRSHSQRTKMKMYFDPASLTCTTKPFQLHSDKWFISLISLIPEVEVFGLVSPDCAGLHHSETARIINFLSTKPPLSF